MPIPAILGTLAGLGLEYAPKAIGALNRLVNPVTTGRVTKRVVKRTHTVRKRAPVRRAPARRAPARKKRIYYY